MTSEIGRNEYVNKIVDELKKNKYSTEYIDDVVKKVYKYQDNNTLSSWRKIKKNYIHVADKDIRFISFCGTVYSVCVKNNDGTFNVAFSFLHKKDLHDKKYIFDDKKYPLLNYINNKYRFDNVKALTSINAVCMAFNKNKDKFPFKDKFKIIPYLNLKKKDIRKYYGVDAFHITEKDKEDFNKYITNLTVKNYKKDLMATGIEPKDIRYYLTFPKFNAMVIRKNGKHYVTFSFLSDKDEYIIKHYNGYKSVSNCININKNSVIKNYLDNKYTYEISDCKDSISSVVRAYNSNKKNFPGKVYDKYKMYLSISVIYPEDDLNEIINYIKYKVHI